MIANLPPLLAIIDGADYERRADAVWRIEHATGKEQRWCHIAEWEEAKARLEESALRRRVRIVTIAPATPPQPQPPPPAQRPPAQKPPKPRRNNGRALRKRAPEGRAKPPVTRKRTPATPEIIERLRAAPSWCCAACGCHDGRERSLKDNRYCKRCARRRPIAGAQQD